MRIEFNEIYWIAKFQLHYQKIQTGTHGIQMNEVETNAHTNYS